jgi:hypothetical protein
MQNTISLYQKPIAIKQESLPFTVRLVKNESDLMKAVSIRQSAYERHVPEFAKTLQEPEQADYEDDTVVFLAESKDDGAPLGTIRIQSNFVRPLDLEKSVELPTWLSESKIAEASRLGIVASPQGSLIKDALVKAFYLLCMKNSIDLMVISARRPLNRMYEKLCFSDVFSDLIPMKHIGNIPHKIMYFDVRSSYKTWTEHNHPGVEFFGLIHHPDISID